MPSQINAVTKDHKRKMEKQLRKAKSKGDIAKILRSGRKFDRGIWEVL